MYEQLALFDASPSKMQATINEKKKRNWENGFQINHADGKRAGLVYCLDA